MSEYEIQPIHLKEAKAFFKTNGIGAIVPLGHLFSIALADRDEWIGVGIVGKPQARRMNDRFTAEITRLRVIDEKDAAYEMLISSAWEAAQGMGYKKLIAYTKMDELSAPLEACGFSRATAARSPEDRIRWEIRK